MAKLILLSLVASVFLAVSCFGFVAGIQNTGINYGLLGNNLPSASQVVSLLKSRNITKVRIFEPNQDVLKAFENSGIQLVVGTLNNDLQPLASNRSFAEQWVKTNVVPYANSIDFRYITAGNEVIPGELASYVLPAIQNLDEALTTASLGIPVTTAIATSVLGSSNPPSQVLFCYFIYDF